MKNLMKYQLKTKAEPLGFAVLLHPHVAIGTPPTGLYKAVAKAGKAIILEFIGCSLDVQQSPAELTPAQFEEGWRAD